MSSKSVAVPASSVTMLPKSPASIGSRFGSRGADGNDKPKDALFVYRGVRRTSPLPPLFSILQFYDNGCGILES